MEIPESEKKIRARLPLTRFFQTIVPFSAANRLMKLANRRVRLPGDVRREAVSAAGVPCEWLIPAGSPDDRVVLYLHGGGFVFALSPLHIEMVALLAKKMGTRALLVDYRVAPAHPFPAALDDCLAVYRWLLAAGIRAGRIVLAGDSAGGNLVLTMCMKLRDQGEALPAAAACLSPVAELGGDHHPPPGFRDPLLPPRAMRRYTDAYLGRQDPRNPMISPVYGNWRGLPPLLVHAGEDEMLRKDALRVADLARSAGAAAQVKIFPRMWHVWQLYLDLPQAKESLEEIAGFLGAHME